MSAIYSYSKYQLSSESTVIHQYESAVQIFSCAFFFNLSWTGGDGYTICHLITNQFEHSLLFFDSFITNKELKFSMVLTAFYASMLPFVNVTSSAINVSHETSTGKK